MARSSIKSLSTTNKILLGLLIMWISFSFFTIFFNAIKTLTEEKQWLFLSSEQKKEKIFGDIYLFFAFINKNTPAHTNIILYPHTEELFYFGIYNLYPKKIATARDYSELTSLSKETQYEYIATYNKEVFIPHFKKITSFSTIAKNFGILYKRV